MADVWAEYRRMDDELVKALNDARIQYKFGYECVLTDSARIAVEYIQDLEGGKQFIYEVSIQNGSAFSYREFKKASEVIEFLNS